MLWGTSGGSKKNNIQGRDLQKQIGMGIWTTSGEQRRVKRGR